MGAVAVGLTLLVAALHVVFMVLESVLWTGPIGRKIFAQSVQDAQTTRVLALNQGLYNGGLAVLLLWSLWSGHRPTTMATLAYIVAMGVVGGLTAKPTILVLQALPALLAFVAVWRAG